MKRNRSELSRDELGLLLSVCLQRAEEEIDQLKKRLAVTEEAAAGAILRCSELGCGATRVSAILPHHFECDKLFSCDVCGPGCSRDAWCAQHAAGKFGTFAEGCNRHESREDDDSIACITCLQYVRRFYACTCKWVPFEGFK
jgi:hypothetical protein